MLKGFKGMEKVRSVADIDRMIAADLAEKRERKRVQVEDVKEDPDPVEEGKHEDKKRKFAVKNRPHERVWNLLEDQSEVPHVLCSTADPRKAYIDGRIENLLEIIEGLGQHIAMHNQEPW